MLGTILVVGLGALVLYKWSHKDVPFQNPRLMGLSECPDDWYATAASYRSQGLFDEAEEAETIADLLASR